MALSNATLAARVNEMAVRWDNRELEMRNWLSGTATGGPYGDGRYPLSTSTGTVYHIKCPAALQAMIDPTAGEVSGKAAEAAASATAANASAVTAAGSSTQAVASRDAAMSARAFAELARDEANAARGGAELANTAAQAAATSTAADSAIAAQAAIDASADAEAAEAARVAAEAAAAAAATYDPANFYTKTQSDLRYMQISGDGSIAGLKTFADGISVTLNRVNGKDFTWSNDGTSSVFTVPAPAGTSGYSQIALTNSAGQIAGGAWMNGSAQTGYGGANSFNVGTNKNVPVGFIQNNRLTGMILSSGSFEWLIGSFTVRGASSAVFVEDRSSAERAGMYCDAGVLRLWHADGGDILQMRKTTGETYIKGTLEAAGNIAATASFGGVAKMAMNSGAGNTGYIAWYNSAGTRCGYLGYGSGTTMLWNLEGGFNTVNFNGHFVAAGNVWGNSDRRLKTNIRPLTGGLKIVRKMQGVRYDKNGRAEIGFVAQDIPPEADELVNRDREYLSLAYGNAAAIHNEAIKELEDRVIALEALLRRRRWWRLW